MFRLSSRIFEHFAMLTDPVTEFIKLGSTLLKQGTILGPKQADPLSLLNKQIHPFHLDRVSSQTQIQVTLILIHALFVLYKQVSWTVKIQISSCQLVFYYTRIKITRIKLSSLFCPTIGDEKKNVL
jgi:hypothetical protein